MNKEKADMIIYTTEDGLTKVETTFDGDTVWLSIDQMAELFQRDRSVIGKHVRNIFKEGESEKESVWAKFAYTATDGKVYNVDYYNLDVIISVGYRVKSKRGTQFRIWVTGILKDNGIQTKQICCMISFACQIISIIGLHISSLASTKRRITLSSMLAAIRTGKIHKRL